MIWNPVPKNGSIAALQQDAHSAPHMGDSFSLLLPSVACQRSSQLLHLSSSFRVPPLKGFRHNWQEGDPLPSALLFCPIQFPPIGMVKGMASSIGRSWHTNIICNSALLDQETLFLTQKGTFLPKDLQKVRKLRQILIHDRIAYVRA